MHGSIHNRGVAVDLTLYDLDNGQPIQRVSGYDEFSVHAYPGYVGGTSGQRWYGERLRDAIEEEEFQVYQWEWWHFNYKEAQKYPIMNIGLRKFNNRCQKTKIKSAGARICKILE